MSQFLAEHEDIVFTIIREYLNKNRVFNMKKIIPYIKARIAKSSINISYEGIQKILISLAKKKKIVEGTKLTKKDVLIYLRRQIIYDYVKENPGNYIHQIAKELNISSKVIFWHLSVLLKFGFIKKMDIDNHTVYFDSDLDISEINKLYIASKEKSKEIINYLKINNIGITKTQLSRDLKIHHETIEKYVKSLEKCNIILKEKKSNKILYFVKEPLII